MLFLCACRIWENRQVEKSDGYYRHRETGKITRIDDKTIIVNISIDEKEDSIFEDDILILDCSNSHINVSEFCVGDNVRFYFHKDDMHVNGNKVIVDDLILAQ